MDMVMTAQEVTPVTEAELVERSLYPRVTFDELQANIVNRKFIQHDLLTICVLTLANGFTVLGSSACAVPGNFMLDVGQRLAEQDAIGKIWALMGYELKSKVALVLKSIPPSNDQQITYVGTKVIHAQPMSRLAYNQLRGWDLPADENGDDEGFLVEYADGQRPNVLGYNGYVSWSPSDVFHNAYEKIDIRGEGAIGGPTWKDRLEAEVEEINERLTKLREFLGGPLFKALPKLQQDLLEQQAEHMDGYLTVIKLRLVG